MSEPDVPLYLNNKHKVFADAYLINGNASESAVIAGYSFKTRGIAGYKLLKRADVQLYLQERANEVAKETEPLQEQVLSELKTMAFVDYGKFIRIGEDGEPILDLTNADAQDLRAITSVATKRSTRTDKDGVTTTEVTSRLGLADKYRGLELLGKHLGMYKADEQRVVLDVADRLLAARQRLRRNEEAGGGGAGV